MARILVPQADNYARVKRWLESSEAAPAVKAAGLVENVPRPERAATVEDFLIRVATSGAQQAIRVPGLSSEDIRNPNPGGGGSGGGSSCDSGGPGSSSCSTSYGGDSCSVSCQTGFYACCERGGVMTAPSCYCVRQ